MLGRSTVPVGVGGLGAVNGAGSRCRGVREREADEEDDDDPEDEAAEADEGERAGGPLAGADTSTTCVSATTEERCSIDGTWKVEVHHKRWRSTRPGRSPAENLHEHVRIPSALQPCFLAQRHPTDAHEQRP